MAPITASERGNTTARTPTSSSSRAGVDKTTRRRPRKTHPKVLGPLGGQYEVPSAVQTSRLLSLPFEVRNKIWSFALTGKDATLRFDSDARRWDTKEIGAGLSTACHQIALETKDVPLKVNRLSFDGEGFLQWHRRLTSPEPWVWEISVGDVVMARKRTGEVVMMGLTEG